MKFCDTCHSSYPGDFVICPKDKSSLRVMADLMPGLVLRGKYEIIEKVGSGGMGAVYKARHLAFDEMRAIKFLGSHLATDQGCLQRFRSEAVLAHKLHHPNVVRVEDLDATEDGRPFTVMEHVEGRSLRDVIRNGGPVSVARAVEIAIQACAALAAAHSMGILHRDIKPDNMVLVHDATGREQVKVLDFGLAKLLEGFEGASGQVTTGTGTLIGTPQYLSPEQAMPSRGVELDGRADLYALGIVLYEMLTGVLPFHADSRMGMLLEHIQTQPLAPDEAFPELRIPTALSDVVMKALEKERGQRYASAEEMGAALEDVASTLPSASAGPELATESGPASSDERPSSAPTGALLAVPPRWAKTPTAELRKTPAAPLLRAPTPPTEPFDMGPPRPLTRPVTLVEFADLSRRSPSRLSLGLLAGVIGLAWSAFGRSGATPPASQASIAPVAPSAQVAPARRPAAHTPSAADDNLAVAVRQGFAVSQPLRDARIDVAVSNSNVILAGDVPDAVARDTAARLAANVDGVHRVFNDLRIPVGASSQAPISEGLPEVLPVPGPTPLPPPPPPDDKVRLMLDRARRQIEAGNDAAALKLFEDVLKLDPGNPIANDALERNRNRPPPPRR